MHTRRKGLLIAGAILAVFALLIGICAILHYSGCTGPEFKIFGELSELNCFEGYDTEEIGDIAELVEGLDIKERNCFEVDFKGTKYNVYGYVFASEEDALSFAERYGDTDRSNRASYIINSGEKALMYTGGVMKARQFRQFLLEHLSEKVDYLS